MTFKSNTWLFLWSAEADGFRVSEPEEVGREALWRHGGGDGKRRPAHLRVPESKTREFLRVRVTEPLQGCG